jgi:alpha-L-fucosidase
MCNGKRAVWEANQTFSGSWGYYRDEYTWKSTPMLIRMLVNTVSKGGNLLLNVGPTARGQIEPRALERLDTMGQWMDLHGQAIYGCTAAPEQWTPPRDCRYTWNPETNKLYVHVYAWPFKVLRLPGMEGKIKYAQMLHDGSELFARIDPWVQDQLNILNPDQPAADAYVELPVQEPDVAVPVIELTIDPAAVPTG